MLHKKNKVFSPVLNPPLAVTPNGWTWTSLKEIELVVLKIIDVSAEQE